MAAPDWSHKPTNTLHTQSIFASLENVTTGTTTQRTLDLTVSKFTTSGLQQETIVATSRARFFILRTLTS